MEGSPKKICVISNKIDLTRDYSEFVNSCDVVFRVSKMENLDGGLTGSKLDYAVVSTFEDYYQFSKEERHLNELSTAKTIYLHNPEKWPYYYRHNQYLINELPNANYDYFPDEIYSMRDGTQFTTFGIAIMIASKKYPNDQLYLLGDKDTKIRTMGYHPNVEMPFINGLIESGKAIHIFTEEANGNISFSKPMSEEDITRLVDLNLKKRHLTYYTKVKACNSLGRDIDLRIYKSRLFDATNNRFGIFPANNWSDKQLNKIIKLEFDDGSYELYGFDPLYNKHKFLQAG